MASVKFKLTFKAVTKRFIRYTAVYGNDLIGDVYLKHESAKEVLGISSGHPESILVTVQNFDIEEDAVINGNGHGEQSDVE